MVFLFDRIENMGSFGLFWVTNNRLFWLFTELEL